MAKTSEETNKEEAIERESLVRLSTTIEGETDHRMNRLSVETGMSRSALARMFIKYMLSPEHWMQRNKAIGLRIRDAEARRDQPGGNKWWPR